jgi:CAAX protease family protein
MNAITSFVKRYPLAVFFAISIITFYAGVAWSVAAPDSPWFLTIFGTGLGALLVVGLSEGRAGVKEWASRIVRWRVGWIWYVVVLGLTPLMRLAAMGLNVALGAPAPSPGVWAAWPDVLLQFALVMLVIAPGEETGFRGYALPKLMQRHSPLVATLILAVMRVIWHLPLFVVGEDSWWVVLMVLGGDFLFAWVFQNTRGSVLLAMLLHAAFNASGQLFFPMFSGAYALQQDMLLGFVFVLVAVAIVVVAGPDLTRRKVAEPEGAATGQALPLKG